MRAFIHYWISEKWEKKKLSEKWVIERERARDRERERERERESGKREKEREGGKRDWIK